MIIYCTKVINKTRPNCFIAFLICQLNGGRDFLVNSNLHPVERRVNPMSLVRRISQQVFNWFHKNEHLFFFYEMTRHVPSDTSL